MATIYAGIQYELDAEFIMEVICYDPRNGIYRIMQSDMR